MKKIKSFLMAIALIAIILLAGCRPGTVTNPVTGKTWMDRNLGASQVATSSTDEAAYGNLYQWGRAPDGHESRTSGTTTIKATTAVPGAGNPWDGLFIVETDPDWNNWLRPLDYTLWEGVSGTNNPCPSGFRLPTKAEWEEERLSWATNDANGAFGSPLKLTAGGWRDGMRGDISISVVGKIGYYWGSVAETSTSRLFFNSLGLADVKSAVYWANGFSVRCIKD